MLTKSYSDVISKKNFIQFCFNWVKYCHETVNAFIVIFFFLEEEYFTKNVCILLQKVIHIHIQVSGYICEQKHLHHLIHCPIRLYNTLLPQQTFLAETLKGHGTKDQSHLWNINNNIKFLKWAIFKLAYWLRVFQFFAAECYNMYKVIVRQDAIKWPHSVNVSLHPWLQHSKQNNRISMLCTHPSINIHKPIFIIYIFIYYMHQSDFWKHFIVHNAIFLLHVVLLSKHNRCCDSVHTQFISPSFTCFNTQLY